MQTFTGIEYLKIDIASSFGLDKKDWDERIAWTDENEDQLEQLIAAAEEPAMYHAGVQAYRKAQNGQKSGYPISLDACASGLQLLSILWGCEASAKLCGVVSTGHREDAYTNLYRRMCDQIGDEAKIQRADTKQAIMTSLFSSQAIPKQVFGEGKLLEVFYETMETYAPGAWELNQVLQGLWQPGALSHDWVLPDNFHCHVEVESQVSKNVQFLNQPVPVTLNVNQGTKEGRSISPNIVHSIDGLIVREIHRRCDFDIDQVISLLKLLRKPPNLHGKATTREKDQMVIRLWDHAQRSGFLSARILDYLNEWNLGHVDPAEIKKLLMTLPEKPFKVISVHDCFRVLPDYGNDLRRQYNTILAEISDSDMLAYIASQVTGQQATLTKPKRLAPDILEADYALS